MKYIDAERLKAEIERLYYNEAEKDESILAADAYKNALDAVENFLDTLSEEPDKSMEEAAEDFGKRQGAELAPFAKKFFKAGAKWMAGQGITVTGDTDDEYIRILEDIEEAICKIAPDSTVNIQIRK